MADGTVRIDLVRPYLPPLVVGWGARHPDVRHRTVDGTLAFLDVSGFTKLSERLARRGRVGAEDLADIINGCFTQLLGVAYGNDASLLKFGGDALLLSFTGLDHAARACRAAVGMRRILREIGGVDVPGGKVLLRMSAGIHSGEFQFFLVGDSHRELVVAGPATTTTAAMEAAAQAGEIVVSSATAAHLPDRVLGEARGEGLLLRASPPGFSRHRPSSEPIVSPAVAAACIPTGLRDYVLAGVHEPAHRQVTVAFLHFGQLDSMLTTAGAEAAASALDALVSRVQKAADRHDVTFLGSDIAPDGGKLILVAGAPRSVDNPDERMLLALRQITDTPDLLPLQIGVTSGPVFAGDIGPPYRQTYTVMGDAVNLSARLMAAAPQGEVFATPQVVTASRTVFETTLLEPFHVRGKARAVEAVTVGEPRRVETKVALRRLPLVGREKELATLVATLDAARRGTGRVVEIVGEPGIGKSRLVAELRDRAEGMALVSTSCTPYESSTPYFPFDALLRQLLGTPREEAEVQAVDFLAAAVDESAPHLRPWLPLLAAVLGVDVAPTPETAQLGEEFRRPRLHAVVTELLEALVPMGLVVTIEGVHAMDEASADLLAHLAAAAADRPWLLCVTRRSTATGFAVPDLPQTQRLELGSLDADQAAAFVAAATADMPVAARQAAELVERSGGNPLFLQELVSASRAGDGAALPGSLEGLLGARIDALLPNDRALLRRVAVLGPSFSQELLPAVLEAAPADVDPVWDRLSGLIERDGAGWFRFPHALIRDVAYEGLPYRLRHTLHAQVGELIEQAADDQADDAELLSYHFSQAQRHDKAWTYSRLAGDRAQALYANVDAARFYERALDAARRVPDLDPRHVAAVWEALGDVLQHAADYTKAAAAFRSARRAMVSDPVSDARLLLKQGILQGWLSRYPSALRWIRRGLSVLENVDSPEAGKQRAQLSVWYARFCAEGGRFPTAISWCHRAVEQASATGERDAEAHAFRLLDWSYARLGELEKATYSPRALEIYGGLEDLAGQNATLNNMAILKQMQGHWTEALSLLQRVLDIAEMIGDEESVAVGTYNMGDLLCDQGRLAEAEDLIGEALRIWIGAGDRFGVATAKRDQARLAARSGDFESALRLFTDARAEFEDIGARFDVVDTMASTAECHLLSGDWGAALAVAAAAGGQAQALGGVPELEPLLKRVRGIALMELDDLDGAKSALAEGLELGRQMQADYQVALTLQALVDLSSLEGIVVRSDLEEESRAILKRLGVVTVPAVPARIQRGLALTGER